MLKRIRKLLGYGPILQIRRDNIFCKNGQNFSKRQRKPLQFLKVKGLGHIFGIEGSKIKALTYTSELGDLQINQLGIVGQYNEEIIPIVDFRGQRAFSNDLANADLLIVRIGKYNVGVVIDLAIGWIHAKFGDIKMPSQIIESQFSFMEGHICGLGAPVPLVDIQKLLVPSFRKTAYWKE